MRNINLVCLFSLLAFAAEASAQQSALKAFESRRAVLERMEQEVIQGKIPVYLDVSCEDKKVTNKLKSLLSKALRELDNVRIVGQRSDAWLWLYLIAIRENNIRVSVAAASGRDPSSWLIPGASTRFVSEADELENFEIYSYPIDALGGMISTIVDKFDVGIMEPVRKNRDFYLMEMNSADQRHKAGGQTND